MSGCRVIDPARRALHRYLRSTTIPLVRLKELDKDSVSLRLRAIGGPYAEASGIYPPAAHERANARLWGIVRDVVPLALNSRLVELEGRNAPDYVHQWPGEHYRLLAALVRLLQPTIIVEIGTYRGHSALAMMPELAKDARLVTMDLISWADIPDCLLRAEDFHGERLTQIIADVGNREDADRHAGLLRSADLIFVDAAKDGVLEHRILANFESVGLKDGAIVVFDDIRVWNMLRIWRDIVRPKLDVTSLGHYSGTGLIDWSGT